MRGLGRSGWCSLVEHSVACLGMMPSRRACWRLRGNNLRASCPVTPHHLCRQVIADAVLADPFEWNEAVLGKVGAVHGG